MVYLDVYNTIFEYLEEIGIVDAVIDYSQEILNPLMNEVKSNEFFNEFIMEFALFNYWHDNKMLLDFIDDTLYDSLDENEKEEFDSIFESERFDLLFNRKIKRNELDTKGRVLYDFYFQDIENNETKIIVSSSPLDNNKTAINARLINNPIHEGKYSIIGGIFDKESYDALSELSSMKLMMDGITKSKTMAEDILKFSKEHSLEEIDTYNNKVSKFPEQDKEIMRLNRLFIDKFSIGFDDFLNNFFELSNEKRKFLEMGEYYLVIVKELNEAIMDTNYMFDLTLLPEKELIGVYLSFIKKDVDSFEKCMAALQKQVKEEFEANSQNQIAMSREKIISNQKNFMAEKIAPLKLKGYSDFIKKIESYSPDDIAYFLKEIVSYVEANYEDMTEENIDFYLMFMNQLLQKPDEIPYLNEILEEQKQVKFNPDEFYDFIDVDAEINSIFIFLQMAHFIYQNKFEEAYALLRREKIEKTQSFDQMFFVGKVLSFFNDGRYKDYFKKAKSIDKARYKIELEKFLKEKEQGILSEN